MVLDTSWLHETLTQGHQGVISIHYIALCTGIVNWLLNGIIWYSFSQTPSLLIKSHLYLFYAFAVTNSFTGFFTVPTYINLIIHNNLNCPRWTILIGSTFEIALDRIRSLLSLSIAIERIHALVRPGDYYFLDHRKVAMRVCLVALIWGIIDAIWMVCEDGLQVIRIHCVTTASSGPIFHMYFLLSSIFFGILLTVVYFFFIFRLFYVKEKQILLNKKISRDYFTQANSLTVCVILMVLLFSVVPCCLYLYDMIVGKVFFMKWGPIITVGYHLYGILSFFFYNWKHRDIRAALQ
ncbi:unnamed protein product [Auanema sp. JU1783]|nr:unnamed protein product [Auanema sp. JU1783]